MDKTLVLAGDRPKRIRLRVAGTALEQTTWHAKGAPKVTTKPFATAHEVEQAFEKAVRKKLREDYVYLATPDQRGDVILEAFAPGGGGGAVLDLSPDGRFVVTASITSESAFGAKLELVEVATGARRIVVEEPGGGRQAFLHAALFDRTGAGIYFTLRDDTEYVELATGARRVIVKGGGFNPHVTRPSFDRARRRLVVFAEGSIVRVLDEHGASLLDVSTAAPLTECRAAAISPSGRLLAVYIVSRGIVYSHGDAKHDTTNEVHLWDIESGERWETVAMREQISRVGLAPDDDELVVTWNYADGPVALAIPSGDERWRVTDPVDPTKLATTFAWEYSPHRTLLALGGHRLRLLDATTRRDLALPERWGRAERVAFSADGARLAVSIAGIAYVLAL